VRIGALSIDDAGVELSPNEALAFMPQLDLDEEQREAVSHGRPVHASATASAPVRLTHGDDLVAVARVEDDRLHPEVVLA
jgi:Pseudouridine synthase II TruB, C-terminal